jgi:hypothetical protein
MAGSSIGEGSIPDQPARLTVRHQGTAKEM